MYFLDNASTTRCFESSAEIIKDALINDYFNPSAKYGEALNTQKELNECRKVLLNSVGAINYDCYFTGSATESNNLVLNTLISKHYKSLISGGEHSSVYEPANADKKVNFNIEFLSLMADGRLDIDDFSKRMDGAVGFISVMLVNNETGSINDIKQIVEIAKSINPKVLVHVDAVQGFCKVPIFMEEWGVDYLTLSSHKINGPKGVGVLVVRKKCKVLPQILGGGQENGVRSGTENLPCIKGFINSVKIHQATLEDDYKKVKEFKELFWQQLTKKAEAENIIVHLNGSMENSSPYILSVSFVGIRAEILLHSLEKFGILVGTGSACNSHHSGNRVLEGLGKTKAEVEGNIRFSFEQDSTNYDSDYITTKVIECVKEIKRK